MADANLRNGMNTNFNIPGNEAATNGGYNYLTNSQLGELASTANMKAALTALAPASYTAARLNQMTWNDMTYAYRVVKGFPM